jgi:NADP-dependent 3-hydroxy acid dehydrogenase YdfG
MNKVCVVMGVGPGNGEAFVRRFSAEGFQVAMLARSQDYLKQLEQWLTGARAFACDLMEPEQITAVLAAIESELGPSSWISYR